jgi:hypothetical protein
VISSRGPSYEIVMTGLVPGIHVFPSYSKLADGWDLDPVLAGLSVAGPIVPLGLLSTLV